VEEMWKWFLERERGGEEILLFEGGIMREILRGRWTVRGRITWKVRGWVMVRLLCVLLNMGVDNKWRYLDIINGSLKVLDARETMVLNLNVCEAMRRVRRGWTVSLEPS
jgi:hypothetical protein